MGYEVVSESNYRVPILLLIFNRPAQTASTFEVIARVRPRELYIAADGAREGHPTDVTNCSAARDIVTKIYWPCEVRTLFRNSNLGCRTAVSSGIDWFFEHVERGVILEDDCLPAPGFFAFCEELLSRYENDTRVMHITGTNLNRVTDMGGNSYTFSKYTPIWGWATWRRAWKHYDVEMSRLDEIKREGVIETAFPTRAERLHREILYELVRQRKIDTWDYQWNFALTASNGLSIIPAKSMIRNIGFGEDATHTKDAVGLAGAEGEEEAVFPLRHPSQVAVNREYDEAYFNSVTRVISPIRRLLVKRWLPRGTYAAIKRLVS